MGVMTEGAFQLRIRVYVLFHEVLAFVAVKTEFPGVRHKDHSVLRFVRIVAHRASARGQRAVYFFDRQIEDVAIGTKFLQGHDEIVGIPDMTPVAKFSPIGAMLKGARFFDLCPGHAL